MGELVMITDKNLYPNLPFHPLALYLAGHDPLPHDMTHDGRVAYKQIAQRCGPGQYVGNGELALRLGMSEKTVERWWTNGIRFALAENLCDRIRIHPSLVWDDYYYIINTVMGEMALNGSLN